MLSKTTAGNEAFSIVTTLASDVSNDFITFFRHLTFTMYFLKIFEVIEHHRVGA